MTLKLESVTKKVGREIHIDHIRWWRRNVAGIGRDAAGHGLSVVLCEKADLASHTSSASTKPIHDGHR